MVGWHSRLISKDDLISRLQGFEGLHVVNAGV